MRLSRAVCGVASLVAASSGCTPFTASDDPAGVDGGLDGGLDAPIEAATLVGASCKALLDKTPALLGKNGFYDITPSGAEGGAPLHVYCDMTLDQGGWTLVGRSAPFAVSSTFGWKSSTGKVTDLNQAYSLGVAAAGLVFGEVLVAARDAASPEASARAYKFGVAADFLAAHTNGTVTVGNVVTVLGDCNPGNGGPEMLRNAGATSLADGFFLRDVPGLDQHRGLQVTGFALSYQTCTRAGLLDGLQGAIFVR